MVSFHRWIRIRILAMAALLPGLLLGCPKPIFSPGGLLDLSGVLRSLDVTLTNVTSDGDRWIATLDALVRDLQGQGLTQAANHVRDILQNGIARVGVEYRCNVDYTATRIRQGLRALRAAIEHAQGDAVPPPEEYQPLVCSASPDRVAWQEAPQSISLAGYDFSRQSLSVAIVEPSGQEIDISFALTQSSPYQIMVNLSGSGAAFPRACAKIVVRWQGTAISEVSCLTDCPPAPPPIVIPPDEKIIINETHTCTDSMLTGCRFDRHVDQACPDGYFRVDPFEVTRVAGRGKGHCGEGDPNTPGPYGSHWQSPNPSDCSIHEHIGLSGGTFNGYLTCHYVVTARRPEQVIPRPAPVVGWCR